MDVNHLLDLLYVGALYATGGLVILAVACVPFGAVQTIKSHNKRLLHFAGTCLGIALFFGVIAAVLYFTASQASKPL